MSASDVEVLRLEHTFAGTPEEVFDAWTDPEVLRRWWAAQPTWTSPGCDVDLRVGGRYTLRMRDEDTGKVHEVGGEYREIERPHRLVYTWCWSGADGLHPGHESLVSVEFHPSGDGTAVLLEHGGLASEESRVRHRAGWLGTFDNLGRRVFDSGHARRRQPTRGGPEMGTYLLAYRGGRMAETDAEREQQMAAWGTWLEQIGDAVVDPGNPFSQSATVGGDGGSGAASSGLSGYSVVKANDLAAATTIAEGCPILANGGSVDVYETFDAAAG